MAEIIFQFGHRWEDFTLEEMKSILKYIAFHQVPFMEYSKWFFYTAGNKPQRNTRNDLLPVLKKATPGDYADVLILLENPPINWEREGFPPLSVTRILGP